MKMIDKKYVNALIKVAAISYFGLLAYITLFSKRRELLNRNFRDNANLHFMAKLYSYNDLSNSGKFYFIEDIIGNVVLFLPFAMAVAFLFPKRQSYRELFFWMLLTILSIESLQYIYDIGVFDIDDIVLNLAGGVAGMFFLKFIYRKYVV